MGRIEDDRYRNQQILAGRYPCEHCLYNARTAFELSQHMTHEHGWAYPLSEIERRYHEKRNRLMHSHSPETGQPLQTSPKAE